MGRGHDEPDKKKTLVKKRPSGKSSWAKSDEIVKKRPSGKSGWAKTNEARKAAAMAAAKPSKPEVKKSPGRVVQHEVTRLEIACSTDARKSVGTQTDAKLDEGHDEGYDGDCDDRLKNWSRNLFDERQSHESGDTSE